MSRESIDALTDLLARSWKFQSPLIEIISQDDTQRKQYTEEQFRLLDSLDRQNKALICGCAGSGKTFLAAEKARRLAQEGYRVGFLCWNNKLASWLKQKMNNIHGVYVDTVTKFIQTNYSYQFDALIVDEAQDIPGDDDWQLILNKLINEGIIYIFYDDNQKIFNKDKKLSFPIKTEPLPLFLLSTNCRNTDKIHNLTLNFYRSSNKLPTALIQSPKDPEIKYCDNGIESMMLNILDKLIVGEKINPQNIIVLTPRKGKSKYKQVSGKAPKVSDWSPAKLINEKYLIYHGEENLQAYKSANKGLKSKNYIEIECSTIQTFKGLEKQVVIVTEIDSLIFQSNFNEVLYVGLSRCQSHLIILFQEELSLIKFNEICNHI